LFEGESCFSPSDNSIRIGDGARLSSCALSAGAPLFDCTRLMAASTFPRSTIHHETVGPWALVSFFAVRDSPLASTLGLQPYLDVEPLARAFGAVPSGSTLALASSFRRSFRVRGSDV